MKGLFLIILRIYYLWAIATTPTSLCRRAKAIELSPSRRIVPSKVRLISFLILSSKSSHLRLKDPPQKYSINSQGRPRELP
jgi:hypothetical protein